MKKRPTPATPPTAFSIARQLTGPPFSVTLENAELRRHLMQEMLPPAAPAGKTPPKRRSKQPKK
jgi:hypothetical protein